MNDNPPTLESRLKWAYDATWCGWDGRQPGEDSVKALAAAITADNPAPADIKRARDALQPVLQRCVVSRARDRVLEAVEGMLG